MAKNYPLYKADSYTTFTQCLDEMAVKRQDAIAITVYDAKGDLHERSFLQFEADVRSLMAALRKRNLAGQHIALAGENSYEWAVTLWALTCSGSVAVVVDIEQQQQAVCNMALRGDASSVICSQTVYELLAEEGSFLDKMIVFSSEQLPGAESFYTLLEEGRELIAQESALGRSADLSADDVAIIVYTSGTTSSSKPVILTHGNLMHNACSGPLIVLLGMRTFNSLPLFHTYSLTNGLLTALTQGRNICLNGSIKTTMRDLQLFQPDTIVAVPLLAETLLRAIRRTQEVMGIETTPKKRRFWQFGEAKNAAARDEAFCRVVGNNLSVILCGGAAMNEQVTREFKNFAVDVLQGYGITECSPLVSVNRNLDNHPKSVGTLLPGLEMKLVDEEIWVKGPSVSPGYYKDEALTAEAFEDGWFKTGDLGYVGGDKIIYIRGRKKNLIVFANGKKVTPEEIEAPILQLPLVKEAVVYGATNGASADDVSLSLRVYVDEENAQGLAQIEIFDRIKSDVQKINRGLPSYKKIMHVTLTDQPFAKTASKKIKRSEVLK